MEKRNKYIDQQMTWNFIAGVGFLIFAIAIVLIQAKLFSETGYSNIAIFTSLALILISIKVIKTKVESILLQRMKRSEEFKQLLKTFGFKEVDTNCYTTTLNGYLVTMENQVNTSIKFDGGRSSLFLDLFCDCSTLSHKEIRAIERKDFTVLHHSIRKYSSNWLVRFNPLKISNYLNDQLQIVEKHQLPIINQEEFK